MYQVIIKDKFSKSLLLAQAFLETKEDAYEIKDYINENYHTLVTAEVISVDIMNRINALQLIETVLWSRAGIQFDENGKSILNASNL